MRCFAFSAEEIHINRPCLIDTCGSNICAGSHKVGSPFASIANTSDIRALSMLLTVPGCFEDVPYSSVELERVIATDSFCKKLSTQVEKF